MNRIEERIYGTLYGQAVGDALGLGTEFMSRDEVGKYYPGGLYRYGEIIRDAHRSRWAVGAWTDDTDMMLCILDAFERDRFEISKIAANFKEWFNGAPLGIGAHTYKVLCMRDYVEIPEQCSKLWWELSGKTSAANGALMRTSAVGLAPLYNESQAEDICRQTHYDPRCVGSCVIVSNIIHNLVWHGVELSYDDIIQLGHRYDDRITEWVDRAFNSTDIISLDLDDRYTIGYTLRTLSAALWCYCHATSFEDGLINVVNAGGDADTNAATACAILGAKFGFSSIPYYYIEELYGREELSRRITTFIKRIQKDYTPL